MILELPDVCEAYSEAGNRCTRTAEGLFATPGDAMRVCPMHHSMLELRDAAEAEQFVRRWRSLP